jgi:hypothetical protein
MGQRRRDLEREAVPKTLRVISLPRALLAERMRLLKTEDFTTSLATLMTVEPPPGPG